ncbi:hypothetical protein NLU13_0875 [Sarocladium strictum]|uniref:Uncharacterized protein n=1 Tax=Sarocladium strictum TaxID=5046 RepID=A0AA39GRT7_SARSR|nr:hypothetical protein NLU13_0875 [Sarocladium strictum]
MISRFNTIIGSLCISFIVISSLYIWSPQYNSSALELNPGNAEQVSVNGQTDRRPVQVAPSTRAKQTEAIISKASKVAPISAPYKDKFGELGRLTRSARKWVQFLDGAPSSENTKALEEAINGAIANLFPFISNSPKHATSQTPFSDLRNGIEPGSRGFVIPTGKSTMRYAAHLVSSVQHVLSTHLPIMIVYAGDQDFPPADRDRFQAHFTEVEFLDILTVVDDATLRLGDGGWAIKAFAALYAPYEQVILADADCVFAQSPELLFEDPSYVETGALLFHDRLLWQHAFQDRHKWWQSQITHPSAALNQSLVWTQDYAEEGDSGVVVLDKSRLDVLMGLLHIAWQNTKAVRDEVTYQLTYGDKESWWFGLELSHAKYAFEKHYGAMVGWPRPEPGKEDKEKVCSFYIAHVDVKDALFWYNGGLLMNKRVDSKKYGVPTHLMIDGQWHKGNRDEHSCMDGVKALDLPEDTIRQLNRSVELAKELDNDLNLG